MSNRVDIQNRIQQQLNNTTYYTIDDMNQSIQDGLDEIVPFTGAILKSAELSFVANLSYYDMITLLGDYVGVYAIFNSVIHRWMTPLSIRKFAQSRPDWEASIGTPFYFSAINHRYVTIYKKPSAAYGKMFIYYVASAPTLGDATVIPLPEDHITALNEYCYSDLWEQQQEFTKATSMLQSYIKNLDELRVLIANKRNADRIPQLR